jgi:Family of unknown function (DUF6266)
MLLLTNLTSFITKIHGSNTIWRKSMSLLIEKMIRELKLKAMSEKTIKSYVSYVNYLAKYYKKSPENRYIPLGLDGKVEGITKYNVFRKINFPTISGTPGAFVVDNAGIVLSRGKLETLNASTLTNAGLNLTVNWNYGSYGVGIDQITVVAYNPIAKQTVVNTATIRSAGNAALSVPAMWAKQQVFVYIFTGNGDISSTSQFVGSVTV